MRWTDCREYHCQASTFKFWSCPFQIAENAEVWVDVSLCSLTISAQQVSKVRCHEVNAILPEKTSLLQTQKTMKQSPPNPDPHLHPPPSSICAKSVFFCVLQKEERIYWFWDSCPCILPGLLENKQSLANFGLGGPKLPVKDGNYQEQG